MRMTGTATTSGAATTGTVAKIARSARSMAIALGSASASGDGRPAGRAACTRDSHCVPLMIATADRTRSIHSWRIAVKPSVQSTRTVAVDAIARRGPSRPAGTTARSDAANTANAMPPSDVFGSVPKRDW